MATAIEWTDETWNPVVGCERVSKGCDHCYAKQIHDNRHKAFLAGRKVAPQYAAPFERVQLMPERLDYPLHWRKPRRCFVNSVSDVFHEDVPDEFIAQIWATMALARAHTFQVLTKRPERMSTLLGDPAFREIVDIFAGNLAIEQTDPANRRRDDLRATCPDIEGGYWPLPNVWLGVSVENQACANYRIPLLLQTPAAVRFLSCEPLLGPVNLDKVGRGPWYSPLEGWTLDESGLAAQYPCPMINWVIVGGESGASARPCDVAWIEEIVRICRETSVPCFVKQLGTVPMESEQVWRDREVTRVLSVKNRKRVPDGFVGWAMGDNKGGNPLEWPLDLRVREFPHAVTEVTA
jgi:protein gp37